MGIFETIKVNWLERAVICVLMLKFPHAVRVALGKFEAISFNTSFDGLRIIVILGNQSVDIKILALIALLCLIYVRKFKWFSSLKTIGIKNNYG